MGWKRFIFWFHRNLAYKYYELRGEPEGNIPVNGFKHQE